MVQELHEQASHQAKSLRTLLGQVGYPSTYHLAFLSNVTRDLFSQVILRGRSFDATISYTSSEKQRRDFSSVKKSDTSLKQQMLELISKIEDNKKPAGRSRDRDRSNSNRGNNRGRGFQGKGKGRGKSFNSSDRSQRKE